MIETSILTQFTTGLLITINVKPWGTKYKVTDDRSPFIVAAMNAVPLNMKCMAFNHAEYFLTENQ